MEHINDNNEGFSTKQEIIPDKQSCEAIIINPICNKIIDLTELLLLEEDANDEGTNNRSIRPVDFIF